MVAWLHRGSADLHLLLLLAPIKTCIFFKLGSWPTLEARLADSNPALCTALPEIPEASSLSGSVLSVSVSISTQRGW